MKKMREVEYVRADKINLPVDGQVFYMGSRLASVVTNDNVIKTLDGWDNSPDLAYTCLDIWRARGFKGAPASAASFFREEMQRHCDLYGLKTKPFQSANNLFLDYTIGGWIETRKTGVCLGSHWHYDINSAYMWASEKGLPMNIKPYAEGDKHFIVLVEKPRAKLRELPNSLERAKVALFTSEEMNYYGVQGRIIDGVSYTEASFQVTDVLAKLHYLPNRAFKRCTQSFWGTFAAREPMTVVQYKGGHEIKRWSMTNNVQNMTWANLIIRRVMRRVHGPMQNGSVLCFVDSVLSPYEMVVGNNPGDWKLVECFDTGVYIHCAGVWDRFPQVSRRKSEWYKHAGYADDPTEILAADRKRKAASMEPVKQKRRKY